MLDPNSYGPLDGATKTTIYVLSAVAVVMFLLVIVAYGKPPKAQSRWECVKSMSGSTTYRCSDRQG